MSVAAPSPSARIFTFSTRILFKLTVNCVRPFGLVDLSLRRLLRFSRRRAIAVAVHLDFDELLLFSSGIERFFSYALVVLVCFVMKGAESQENIEGRRVVLG